MQVPCLSALQNLTQLGLRGKKFRVDWHRTLASLPRLQELTLGANLDINPDLVGAMQKTSVKKVIVGDGTYSMQLNCLARLYKLMRSRGGKFVALAPYHVSRRVVASIAPPWAHSGHTRCWFTVLYDFMCFVNIRPSWRLKHVSHDQSCGPGCCNY